MSGIIYKLGAGANYAKNERLYSEAHPVYNWGIGSETGASMLNWEGQASVANLKKEDGFDLLQESGDYILL